jgi:hypothetical protein
MYYPTVSRVAQSVYRLTTGWTDRGLNSGKGKIFHTCLARPWGPPSLLNNGYRVFPWGRTRPRRDADLSPLLAPRYKKKSTAVHLFSLMAFVACKQGETYLLCDRCTPVPPWKEHTAPNEKRQGRVERWDGRFGYTTKRLFPRDSNHKLSTTQTIALSPHWMIHRGFNM